jgi:hypothetical protein
MRYFRWTTWACLTLAVAAWADEPQSGIVAFVNVSVVPMDSERVLPAQSVVVHEGRIATVGPAKDTDVPQDALCIDGKGKYLMPGLADMHVHTWNADELTLFVANGVTTIRNMFGAPMHLRWREHIAQGELFGPTIYTAGPILDGDPPVWPGSDVVTSARRAKRIVRRQHRAGYDFLKVYTLLTQEAYDGIVAAANEHEMRFCGHVPEAVGLEYVLDSGIASIEHLDGYGRALRSDSLTGEEPESRRLAWVRNWTNLDPAKLPAIVEMTRQAGTWNCPTIVVYTNKLAGLADPEAAYARPEMRYLSPSTKNMWLNMMGEPPSDDVLEQAPSGVAACKRVVKALHDGGARLLLGTDALNPFVIHGYSLHEELHNFVDAGLTPYEALRAGTHDAAAFFDALDEFGVVTEGRRADLILVEANPLEDVANASKRVGVMLRGRWLPEEELKAMLEALATKYAASDQPTTRNAQVPELHDP